jgi:hypothetical protein
MRNCETIGIPSMFRSRVMGVGSQRPDMTKEQWTSFCQTYPNSGYCDLDHVRDLISQVPRSRLEVCHPDSPAGTCKPVDWKPNAVSTPAPAPAKPTGSALPLLIGAAFLLLS